MHRLITVALIFASACAAAPAQPGHCDALSNEKKIALTNYVRVKYKLPDSTTLSLASDATISTCFHELTFQGVSPLKKWELKLYLSPDGRYLTSDLYDTAIDPVEEEQRRMRTLMDSLAANKGASYGPDSAPVTIIEFSDFQCPYCRKLSAMMQEVLPTVAGKVRVVFHHTPLQMHSWARTAAEAAACAQFQGSKPFWTIQRQIFERQGEITAENVKAKLVDIAHNVPDLDLNSFQTCFDNEMSLGLVLRDIDLATANEINATPTVFINGHRLQGIKDAKQLLELIDAAAKDANEKSEAAARPDAHAALTSTVGSPKAGNSVAAAAEWLPRKRAGLQGRVASLILDHTFNSSIRHPTAVRCCRGAPVPDRVARSQARRCFAGLPFIS